MVWETRVQSQIESYQRLKKCSPMVWETGVQSQIESYQRLQKCSPMVWETGVQSQIKSYQRLKKWYLVPPCLILSIIRYASRVKWSNPGKGITPSQHLGVVAIEKGAFRSPLTKVNYIYNIYIYKQDLALNNQQEMVSHIIQLTNQINNKKHFNQ